MHWSVRFIAYALFFASGATALVYQIAWTRNLSLIFGASHVAISIVLGSFMAGLALGGVCLGRWSTAHDRPLRLYGILEAGVALFALVLPFLLRLVDGAYVALAVKSDGVTWWLNAARAAMAFAVLVLPTFLMGGTLPVLSRFLVHRYGELAVRLSSLYGINTVGAVVGVIASGFYLIPNLGVWRTQLIAVAGNLLIAAIAVLFDRRVAASAETESRSRQKKRERRDRTSPPTDEEPAPIERGSSRYWALRLTFWGTAVSGMCALALEVLWTRGIAVSSGTTVYSFASMLAAFLIGISIGSWLHAVIPLKRIDESLQFGCVLLIAGASTAWVSQSIPRLPELAVQWNQYFYSGSPGTGPKTVLFLAFAIMLVPCVCMGIAFPLAGQARARLQAGFARSVGDTVGLNTSGAILGSILAGFVLIPTLGLQTSMLMLASVYLGYGALVLIVASGMLERPKRLVARAIAIAGIATAVGVPLFASGWDIHLLGTFRNNNLMGYTEDGDSVLKSQIDRAALLYYAEGEGSNVSVFEIGGYRSLAVNGKVVAGDELTDLQHELLLGHLPVLLHPDPKSAVVVGLGAGITLGAVAAHEDIEDIVLVEIEPAVFEGAAQFADITFDATRDPRLDVFYQDGRNFLKTTGRRFDVVTADPIHPWAQGAAYLYTRQYYEMVSRRLNDGGVMCQWLPLYDLSWDDLRTIAASFCPSFAHTTIWQTSFDAVLIGSNEPLRIDAESLARRLTQPKVAAQLFRVGLDDPLSFLSEFCLDDAGVRAFAEGAIVNTDDNLYIEFSSPLSVRSFKWVDNLRKFVARRDDPRVLVPNIDTLFDPAEQSAETLATYDWAKRQTVDITLLAYSNSPETLQMAQDRCWKVMDLVPDYGLPRRLWGLIQTRIAARQDPVTALATCRSALEISPRDHALHYEAAQACMKLGRIDEAIEHYRESARLRPRQAAVRNALSSALSIAGRSGEAQQVLRECLEIHPTHTQTATNLAWQLATCADPEFRDGDQAVQLARKALGMPGARESNGLATLAVAYAESGNLEQAIESARKALALARQQDLGRLANQIQNCLKRFEAGQPYHVGARNDGDDAS